MRDCIICKSAITSDDYIEVKSKEVFICDSCLDVITRQWLDYKANEYKETSKLMRGLTPQGDVYANKALEDSKLLSEAMKLI